MGASLQLIENNSLRAREDGYEILVRLNWYRSLPLSCVDSLHMSLDGEPVPAEQILFEINEHQYRLDELPERTEEFWFVQDSARLHVVQPGKVKAGETHQVEAEIAMRFPYIAIGPGKFLTTPTRCTLTQTAK